MSKRSTKAKRPFVFINMAMTADGKIATANRKMAAFGSERDAEHLYELRATADAVMSGARTLESGPFKLGPGGKKYQRQRLKRGLAEFNLRIIVSGSGTIDPRAEIFKHDFSPILILTTERASKAKLKKLESLADEVKVCGRTEIDWPTALEWLRDNWDVKRLLSEGGGELNDGLFRAGVVDELNLTLCPMIAGGRKAPTIADGEGVLKLADATQLRLKSVKHLGDELFLVYRSIRST